MAGRTGSRALAASSEALKHITPPGLLPAASTSALSPLARTVLKSSISRGYAHQVGQPVPPSPPPSSEKVPSTSDAAAAQVPASTAKDIKPVSSLASQYLNMTELPPSAEEAEAERQRTGARSTAGARSMSSIEKKRQLYGRFALAFTFFGGGLYAWHLGRDWESEKEKSRVGRNVTTEEGLEGRWQRGKARAADMADYFNKPAWEPLLPEPGAPPHQKPYTLVLSLDDLLIHSGWDREHGWRTAKRPGVDYFLAYLSQFYEIVLFTAQPPYTAIPIVEKLDPYGVWIIYKLFRDCTRYFNKEIVKDLSYLGRDLSKTIMLDTDPQHCRLQPENTILMKPWDGNTNDRDLIGMIPFLEAIAIFRAGDVRQTLDKYAGKHIPTAWAEVEEQLRQAELAESESRQASIKGRLGGGFGNLFGLSSPQARMEVGPRKTLLERERELYQKSYVEEQKYWADNKAEIEKMMEEDRERQKREMGNSVMGFVTATLGLAPPPNPEASSSASKA